MTRHASFKNFLLARHERDKTRRWVTRKRAVHDICDEFAQDCAIPVADREYYGLSPFVPEDDEEVYRYIDERIPDNVLMPDGQTKALDYLWREWKRKQR
jgi:hypothetical protein